MRLYIQEQIVVRIGQSQAILFLIAEDGNGDAMNVLTEIAVNVLIGIGGLHDVDGSHQTRMLIGRIAVHHNILDCRAQLHISRLFQPAGNASGIKIVDSQPLVVNQQRYQLVDIISYQVPLRVYHKAVILQHGRGDVNLYVLAEEPALHLIIPPTVLGIDGSKTLNEHLDTVRKLIQTRQTAFILLTHHDAFVLIQRILTQPERHQGKT